MTARWFIGRGIAATILIVLWASPPMALAQGNDAVAPVDPAVERAYSAGQAAYQLGQYARVIQFLRPLVVPKTRINTKDRLLFAYKMLAISYVFQKDIPAAEGAFGAILAEDPSYDLDPSVDPGAAVRIFRDYKRKNAAMLHKIEQAQAQARKNERDAQKRREEELRQLRQLAKQGTTIVERRIVSHSYWLNFIPFGVGQFQNDHRTKGWILFSTEVALGLTSLGTALAYRFAFPDVRSSGSGDSALASGLAITQVVAGALFWAVTIYGIIDALVYYRPKVVTERRRTQKSDISFLFTPTLTQRSAGLGLSLVF